LIYPEGNYIRAWDDRPFLQIGESKYGKFLLEMADEADAGPVTASKSPACMPWPGMSKVRETMLAATPVASSSSRACCFRPELDALARSGSGRRHNRVDRDSAWVR
jgi:hypothetical protein